MGRPRKSSGARTRASSVLLKPTYRATLSHSRHARVLVCTVCARVCSAWCSVPLPGPVVRLARRVASAVRRDMRTLRSPDRPSARSLHSPACAAALTRYDNHRVKSVVPSRSAHISHASLAASAGGPAPPQLCSPVALLSRLGGGAWLFERSSETASVAVPLRRRSNLIVPRGEEHQLQYL